MDKIQTKNKQKGQQSNTQINKKDKESDEEESWFIKNFKKLIGRSSKEKKNEDEEEKEKEENMIYKPNIKKNLEWLKLKKSTKIYSEEFAKNIIENSKNILDDIKKEEIKEKNKEDLIKWLNMDMIDIKNSI